MEIRKASENDRAEILELYKMQIGREFCAWTDDYPGNETIDYDLSRNALFVMHDGEKIVAAISHEQDEDVDALECWDKSVAPGGELARLAVLPSMQNRGIARQMLEYGMGVLKDRSYKSIHFLVNKYNIKAICSYAKLNFNVVGECRMYEQDFLCYEKALD